MVKTRTTKLQKVLKEFLWKSVKMPKGLPYNNLTIQSYKYYEIEIDIIFNDSKENQWSTTNDIKHNSVDFKSDLFVK